MTKLRQAACVLSLFLLGCSSAYMLRYSMDTADGMPLDRTELIASGLADVLKDFGLVLTRESAYYSLASYSRDRESTQPEIMALPGSTANVTVVVGTAPLSVSVADYDNWQETEFVRELKRRIENYLVESGIRGASLEPQSAPFS